MLYYNTFMIKGIYMSTVRTRFAPSPTGSLHIGGIRTALYAWAYAKKNNGVFVLRIEDTDVSRSTKESELTILNGLAWLGIDWDEGPIRQMDRLDRYNEVANLLIEKGLAYRCYDQVQDRDTSDKNRIAFRGSNRDLNEIKDGNFVIRMKVPLGEYVMFDDTLKGHIKIKSDQVEDWILVRQNGVPTYNFAVVVDDWDMKITNVIRGDDHLNNTPKQVILYNMLNVPVPSFTHLPLILGPSGKKLSKRDEHLPGSIPTTLDGMQRDGILPEALLNYMARLGWAHGDDEYFSVAQFLEWFDLDALNAAPAKVDAKKLNWVNAQHLKALNDKRFGSWAIEQLNGNETATFMSRLPQVRPMLNKRGNETATFRQDIIVLNEITRVGYTTSSLEPVVKEAWSRLLNNWDSVSTDIFKLEDSLKLCIEGLDLTFKDFAISLRSRMTSETKTPSLATMLKVQPDSYVKSWLNACISQPELSMDY